MRWKLKSIKEDPAETDVRVLRFSDNSLDMFQVLTPGEDGPSGKENPAAPIVKPSPFRLRKSLARVKCQEGPNRGKPGPCPDDATGNPAAQTEQSKPEPAEKPAKQESPEHAQAKQKAKEKVGQWIKESNLPEEKAQVYQQSLSTVIDKLPHGCLKRFLANTSAIKFSASIKDVTEEYKRLTGKRTSASVGGMWTSEEGDKQGTLHLDGGSDTGEDYQTEGFSAETIQGIYAHEITHSVDGVNYELSKTREWHNCWMEEILAPGHPLTKYATSKSQEGFAEFGRLLLEDPAKAQKDFPKCHAYWRSKGLVD